MFIAFYNESSHGRDRDNYNTCEITGSGAYTSETMEQLLNDMFRAGEYHRKSIKKDHYDYTSITWLGVHEIDIKQTFYRDWDFNIDWNYDGNTSESELLEMIANSDKGKEAAAEAEMKRKEQETKKKAEAVTRKQKRIEAEARKAERDEQHDQDEYERLKLKFEGEKS